MRDKIHRGREGIRLASWRSQPYQWTRWGSLMSSSSPLANLYKTKKPGKEQFKVSGNTKWSFNGSLIVSRETSHIILLMTKRQALEKAWSQRVSIPANPYISSTLPTKTCQHYQPKANTTILTSSSIQPKTFHGFLSLSNSKEAVCCSRIGMAPLSISMTAKTERMRRNLTKG